MTLYARPFLRSSRSGLLCVILLSGCELQTVDTLSVPLIGSRRVPVREATADRFCADIGQPGVIYEFTRPDATTTLAAAEAVFIVELNPATNVPISAELHRVIGTCTGCGPVELRADDGDRLGCPTCGHTLRCRATPRPAAGRDGTTGQSHGTAAKAGR